MVMLQLCGASGASDRVAGSVQRVIAAAVAEPVEAVRPPGGHQRVGSRTNCVRSVTEIRLTDITDHQTERIHVPVKQRDKLFKEGIFVPDEFDPLQNINLSPKTRKFFISGRRQTDSALLPPTGQREKFRLWFMWSEPLTVYYVRLSFSFLLHEHFML